MKRSHIHLTMIGIAVLFITLIGMQLPAVKATGNIDPLPMPTPKIVQPKASRAGIPKAKAKSKQPNNFEWEGETTEVIKTTPNVNPSATPHAKAPRKKRN